MKGEGGRGGGEGAWMISERGEGQKWWEKGKKRTFQVSLSR